MSPVTDRRVPRLPGARRWWGAMRLGTLLNVDESMCKCMCWEVMMLVFDKIMVVVI